MAYIGIDLGTSTSEVAYYKDGTVRLICMVPSYVGIDTNGEFVFGEDAKSQYIGRPNHTVTEFKRLMGTGEMIRLGDKKFRPEEISALLLGYLKRIAEEYLKTHGEETVEEVVITVPANFDDNQRKATMIAAQMAGIKCERIINEPTAAALAFGIKNLDKDMRILVFDFGGGTLDVTVLKMFEGILDVETSYGDTRLGGKDFDERMMELIIRKTKEKYEVKLDRSNLEVLAKLKSAAEQAKIELSNTFNNQVEVKIENVVADGKLLDIEVNITKAEFNTAVKDLVERAGFVIDKALEDKGLSYKDIDYVLMVGGTSNIPFVRDYVERKLGKKIYMDRNNLDPIYAVAFGAAIQAAIKAGKISEENGILITDVCPFNLGIEVAEEVNGVLIPGIFRKMIERNSTIPTTKADLFYTVNDYQTEVNVKVYQTLDNDCVWTKDATLIGEFVLDNIPPRPRGQVPIRVEYSYDINGNLRVVAEIMSTGYRREMEIKRVAHVGDSTYSEEVSKALNQLEKRSINMYKEMELYKKYKMVIETAERKLENIKNENGNAEKIRRLKNLLEEIKQCIVENNSEKAETIESEIVDLLFMID